MKIRRRSSGIALAFLLPVVACKQSTEPINECDLRPASNGTVATTVTTNKATYSLSTDTRAESSFTNEGPGPLYVSGDVGVVQRQVAGQWTTVGGWVVWDGVCATFDVLPGTTLVEGFAFTRVGNQPGTYRFLYYMTRDPAGKRPLSEPERSSPAFVLTP